MRSREPEFLLRAVQFAALKRSRIFLHLEREGHRGICRRDNVSYHLRGILRQNAASIRAN